MFRTEFLCILVFVVAMTVAPVAPAVTAAPAIPAQPPRPIIVIIPPSQPADVPEPGRQLVPIPIREPEPVPQPGPILQPEPVPQPDLVRESEPVERPIPASLAVTRSVTQAPGLFIPDFQCKEENGYYSVAHQCDTYIQCKGGRAMQYVCPDGLHFNPATKYFKYPCAYPSEVKCMAGDQELTDETDSGYVYYGMSNVWVQRPVPIYGPRSKPLVLPQRPMPVASPVTLTPVAPAVTAVPAIPAHPRLTVPSYSPALAPRPNYSSSYRPLLPPRPLIPAHPVVAYSEPAYIAGPPPTLLPVTEAALPKKPVLLRQPVEQPIPTSLAITQQHTVSPMIYYPTVTLPTYAPPRPVATQPPPVYVPRTTMYLPPITQAPVTPAPMTPSYVGRVSVTQAPGIFISDFECKEENGYYSVAHQCDTYIQCKGGRAMQYVCPDGLHFNPATKYFEYPCAYPSEVKCMAGDQEQNPMATDTCPNQYGFYSMQDGDCSRYIRCHEGIATIMDCPMGLVFNTQTSTCDWPVNVPQCDPSVFKDFTCPDPPEDEDGQLSDVLKYRYHADCKLFIACQLGRPRLLSCDSGLAFDEASASCIDEDYVTECAVPSYLQ